MGHLKAYALAVCRSRVALLCGIAGILLVPLGTALPVAAPPIWAAAAACAAVAMFTVWLNERLGREKAEAALADAECRRRLGLEIASLIRQGRDVLAIPHALFQMGNYPAIWQAAETWRHRARAFIAAHCRHPAALPELDGFRPDTWPSIHAEVSADIEMLQAIERAF